MCAIIINKWIKKEASAKRFLWKGPHLPKTDLQQSGLCVWGDWAASGLASLTSQPHTASEDKRPSAFRALMSKMVHWADFMLSKAEQLFPYSSPECFGHCHMLVVQNLQLPKASSWEVNGNISFHSKGKTTFMLFSSASWKLGEKPKAKKSKELKKIHILDCGFCCLSSRENMVMGKGPAWSQSFFQLWLF